MRVAPLHRLACRDPQSKQATQLPARLVNTSSSMAGDNADGIAALPDASGMPNRVVIPAGHVVDYGHSILTDIRLAGAVPVIAGAESQCSIEDIESALSHDCSACLLLVSSR